MLFGTGCPKELEMLSVGYRTALGLDSDYFRKCFFPINTHVISNLDPANNSQRKLQEDLCVRHVPYEKARKSKA